MYTSRIAFENLRTLDSSTLTGSFIPLGTPLTNPSYKLKMVNRSLVDITVSIDGTNAIDVCPSNSFWLYDEQYTQYVEGLPSGTQIYVNGTASTGNIYLVAMYIQQI